MGWGKQELISATGGKILRDGKQMAFGEIVTDSSKAQAVSVFIALKGERHDGHRFIGDAVRRGAARVILQRGPKKMQAGEATTVKVPHTLRALGDLAHYRRERMAPKVLAITGSNGKTTTKEMLAAILEEARVHGERTRG